MPRVNVGIERPVRLDDVRLAMPPAVVRADPVVKEIERMQMHDIGLAHGIGEPFAQRPGGAEEGGPAPGKHFNLDAGREIPFLRRKAAIGCDDAHAMAISRHQLREAKTSNRRAALAAVEIGNRVQDLHG